MGKKGRRRNKQPQQSQQAGGKPGATQPFHFDTTRNRVNPFTATTQEELDAITTPHVVSTDEFDPTPASLGITCWICLEGPSDGNEEPLRRNCACRGDGNYAHLRCLVEYMTARSEEIWTGKAKITVATGRSTWLCFGRPWESCNTCKQYYCGSLRVDIAREYCRSTEGYKDGLKVFRHVTARSWLTKSLMADQSESRLARDVINAEFLTLLDLIKSSYTQYEGFEQNPAVQYVHGTLHQLDYEADYNYAHSHYAELINLVQRAKNEGHNWSENPYNERMKDVYSICMQYMEQAIEKQNAVSSHPILSADSFAKKQMEISKVQIQSQLASMKANFSYLEAKPRGVDMPCDEEEERKKMLELSRHLMDLQTEEREDYTESIAFTINHVQNLILAGAKNPFEIIELLLKTIPKSQRTLGPTHKWTKQAHYFFDKVATDTRKACLGNAPDKSYPVLCYEEDHDVYVLKMEDDEEVRFAPSDIILQPRALVECVKLKGAAHLNGERGYIKSFDEKTGRHTIRFEDTSIKDCLVKPVNLRLLFF